MDIDGSGTIVFTEFCAVAIDFRQGNQDDVLWAIFRAFDIDGTGKISISELQEMPQKSFAREQFSAGPATNLRRRS